MAISCACFAKLQQFSQELAHRDGAIRHLFETINHHGSPSIERLWAAAPVSVPFLLQVLDECQESCF
jgi:hypothetical protein